MKLIIILGTVDLPAEMVSDSKEKEDPKAKDAAPSGKKVKTPLNSNNKLFRSLLFLIFFTYYFRKYLKL